MWLDEANNQGITAVSFKQPDGTTLAPTSDSVLFAVMEKGGVKLDSSTGLSADLTGNYGTSAWPFTGYCYLILRRLAYRETCAIKISTSLGFVIPPLQIRMAHGIDTLINTNIFCGGDLSLPAARTEESIGVGTLLADTLFNLYPPVYNTLAGASGTIVFEPSSSDHSLQRLLFGEVDFAIVSSKSPSLFSFFISCHGTKHRVFCDCNVSVLAASSIGNSTNRLWRTTDCGINNASRYINSCH
jgi:hypothetical protein